MTTIITRKEAKIAGLNKYFTAKECRNGHVAERYVQSGSCSQCINGNLRPVRIKDSKTLIAAATNIEMTALSDFNTNLERITRVYNDKLSQAVELRQQAAENAMLEAETPTVTPISDVVKAELSKLVTVWVPYKPETRDVDEAYYLSLLQSRCPEFTLKELRYRNKNKGGKLFEIRCYPDDLNTITSRQTVHAITTPQSQH